MTAYTDEELLKLARPTIKPKVQPTSDYSDEELLQLTKPAGSNSMFAQNQHEGMSHGNEAVVEAETAKRQELAGYENQLQRGLDYFTKSPEEKAAIKMAKDLPAFSSSDIPFLGPIAAASGLFGGVKPSKFNVGAGREISKLGAGLQNIGLHIAEPITAVWGIEHPDLVGLKPFNAVEAKIDKLAKEQAEESKLMQAFSENKGIPGGLGASLPYMLTGLYGGPATNKIGQLIADVPAKVIGEGIKQGKSLVVKGANALADVSPTVGNFSSTYLPTITHPAIEAVKRGTGTVGRKAQVEWAQPILEKAIHKANVVKLPGEKSALMGNTGQYIGSGLLGAAEGAAHYDNSIGGSALSSIAGTMIGNKIAPWLTRAHNYHENDPYKQELLKTSYLAGRKDLPGMVHGDQETQAFESAMANSDKFSNPIKTQVMKNAIASNRTAWNAATGLPKESIDNMTPADLKQIHDTIGQRYNEIEANTTGVFDLTDKSFINGHTRQYQNRAVKPNATADDKTLARMVTDFGNKFDELMIPRRTAVGTFLPLNITGAQFKDLKSQLKDELDSAYLATENKALARQKIAALKPMLLTLENAVDKGVLKQRGTAGLAEWKKLDTQNMLTRTLIEHGTDTYGRFDPIKWANHREATDPYRFKSEDKALTKPEMVLIDRLSKIGKMENREQAGSQLGGLGLHPSEMENKETLTGKLLQPQNTRGITPMEAAKLELYLKKWPKHTGFLNMSGKRLGDPRLFTRAYEQQAQVYPKLAKGAADFRQAYQDVSRGILGKYVDPHVAELVQGKSISKILDALTLHTRSP